MEKNKEKIAKIEKEKVIHWVPEQEVLISFTNYEDCNSFHRWWNDIGEELFGDYIEEDN